jgi:hypothetical protein
METTIEKTLTDFGGKLWEKGDYRRIYFNIELVEKFIKLNVNYYNTGNISSATLDGKEISNSEARRIISGIDKIYYDFTDEKFHWTSDYDGYVKEFCKMLRISLNEKVEA